MYVKYPASSWGLKSIERGHLRVWIGVRPQVGTIAHHLGQIICILCILCMSMHKYTVCYPPWSLTSTTAPKKHATGNTVLSFPFWGGCTPPTKQDFMTCPPPSRLWFTWCFSNLAPLGPGFGMPQSHGFHSTLGISGQNPRKGIIRMYTPTLLWQTKFLNIFGAKISKYLVAGASPRSKKTCHKWSI